MAKTHWKKLHNPDYLGAYALEPGKDLIVTIKSAGNEIVTGPDGKKEECMVIHFAEKVKPMIINSTNAKTITKLFKTPYIEDWQGKKIQLFTDKVKAFGEVVEALRVRPKAPVEQSESKISCDDCGGIVQGMANMTAEQWAKYSKAKIGRILCTACANQAKQTESEVGTNENNENQD